MFLTLKGLVILEIKYELTGRDRSRDDLVFFFLSTTSPRSIISEWIIFLIDWRFSLSSGFFPIWIEMLRKEWNYKMIDFIWLYSVTVSVAEKRVRTYLEHFNGINHTSTKMSARPKSASNSVTGQILAQKVQKRRCQESIKPLINKSP